MANRARLRASLIVATTLFLWGCPKPVPPVPPPPPTHLISMTWQPVAAPDVSYEIYRGIEPTSMTPYDATTDTRYTDRGVVAGETYYYAVTASDSFGESDRSNVVSARVPMN